MFSHPLSRLVVVILLLLLGVGLSNRLIAPERVPTTLPLTHVVSQPSATLWAEYRWPTPTITTRPKLKVAFIGDTDDGDTFVQLIRLIKHENAELILHQGDFSYAPGPTDEWLAAVDQLDATLPYLGADGNHDEWIQYSPFFQAQTQKPGVNVTHGSVESGSYAATYDGLQMIFNQQGGDTAFNQQVLGSSEHIWKVCSWHHNRRDFQLGDKDDDVALETYQACINGGAFIATGHEHSYSRSYSLRDLTAPHYGAHGAPERMELATGNPGSGFFFVSGLGGRSLRDYHAGLHDDDSWWATIYTENRYCQQSCTATDFSGQDKRGDFSTFSPNFGALFIDFNVDNDPYRARGYFKTIEGDIVDEFIIVVNPEGLANAKTAK